MNALALALLQDVADAVERGTNAVYLAADCYDGEGTLLGTHYAPLALVLAFLEGMRVVDLASEAAGGAVPVDLTAITRIEVKGI